MAIELIKDDGVIEAWKPKPLERMSDGGGLFLLAAKVSGRRHAWRLDHTFERKRATLSLGVYVLPHAIATDLRQAGWDSAEIAQVLGERRAETSRWYGLRWRGSKFRRSPEIAIERGTVKTARPVVRRESDFLATKKEAKAGKKKSATPSNR